jgi:hypothetical protein
MLVFLKKNLMKLENLQQINLNYNIKKVFVYYFESKNQADYPIIRFF